MKDAPGPQLSEKDLYLMMAAEKRSNRSSTNPPPAPPAPPGLSEEATTMWQAIAQELVLMDTHELTILKLAMEAHDRYRKAEEILTAEGLTIVSPSGLRKRHPAHKVAMDNVAEVRRC